MTIRFGVLAFTVATALGGLGTAVAAAYVPPPSTIKPPNPSATMDPLPVPTQGNEYRVRTDIGYAAPGQEFPLANVTLADHTFRQYNQSRSDQLPLELNLNLIGIGFAAGGRPVAYNFAVVTMTVSGPNANRVSRVIPTCISCPAAITSGTNVTNAYLQIRTESLPAGRYTLKLRTEFSPGTINTSPVFDETVIMLNVTRTGPDKTPRNPRAN